MVENDGMESFSQTFSQCSLGEILQVDSQTLDPSIFDQDTPEIELLCETNEVVNSSQKDILIGFDKGQAVTQSSADSEEENTSVTDFLSDIDNNTIKNSSVSEDLTIENNSSEIENYNLSHQNPDSKSSSEDLFSTTEICYVNSPIFVGAEEYVSTTHYEESRSSIIEEYQCMENEARNENSQSTNSNKKIKLIIKKSSIVNKKVKLNDYIELKKKLPNRGRPLKINHDIPNLNRIRDPGKLKYVERRFKNNIASQNSRIKRNIKGKQIKIENEKLEERNEELLKEREELHKIQIKLLDELKKRNIEVPHTSLKKF
ncbi:uncharacterized protein LOC129614340 [Condylostylus longicornis]|uniref:uncharacterized protein LOC129614340 n=1 Tax=Condylostylus longicornis TaxID=2530218 RepID=UPI00244DCDE9|nr:uncharacterized protein LOC129614340 [Condylostylus longicornis]